MDETDDDEKRPDPRHGAQRPKRVLPIKASAPHVYRPSTRAQIEVLGFQRSINLLISRPAISRLVRHIRNEIKPEFGLRVEAIDVFHHAAEDYMVKLLMECVALTHHARRVSIMRRDMILARRFRGEIREISES